MIKHFARLIARAPANGGHGNGRPTQASSYVVTRSRPHPQ